MSRPVATSALVALAVAVILLLLAVAATGPAHFLVLPPSTYVPGLLVSMLSG